MDEPEILCRVEALYSFRSNDPSSLEFYKGDQIEVLTQLPSGWWDGLCKGTRGWFPSNYVRVIQTSGQPPKRQNSNVMAKHGSLSIATNKNLIQNLNVSSTSVVLTENQLKLDLYAENENTMLLPNLSVIDSIYNDIDENSMIVNTQGWSDHNIPSAADEKYHILNRVDSFQSQSGKSDFSNGISTMSKGSSIDSPRSPSTRSYQSSVYRVNLTANERLNWSDISSNITSPIYQLSTAAKTGDFYQYKTNIAEAIDAIRYMLIASAIIKNNNKWIIQNSPIRSSHRSMMASMSKLVLTIESSNAEFLEQDERNSIGNKIMVESSELLLHVRNFINACQNAKVPLQQIDPQWIDDTEYSENKSRSKKYILQTNLTETMRTLGECIRETVDSILGFINEINIDGELRINRSTLIETVFSNFKQLSDHTSVFLGYLENVNFVKIQETAEYYKLLVTKQELFEIQGNILILIQDIATPELDNTQILIHSVQTKLAALSKHIDDICESVSQLAKKVEPRHRAGASLSLNGDYHSGFNDERSISSGHQPSESSLVFFAEMYSSSPPKESENDKNSKAATIKSPAPSVTETVSSSEYSIMDLKASSTSGSSQAVSKSRTFFGDEAFKEDFPTTRATMVTINRPSFLSYDYGPDDLIFSKDGSVRAGTLPALIERLTLHDILDMNFINNFLLTYRSFCSSKELLDLLITRYHIQCPPELSKEDVLIWEQKKLKLVRLRVFNVLKNWIDSYYNDDDSAILDQLLVFAQTSIRKTLHFATGQLESLIERRRNTGTNDKTGTNAGLKKMILTLPAPAPEPIWPRIRRQQIFFLEVDPLEMARQLTIMDFKLYSAIRPIECLDKTWSRDDGGAAVAVNIRASIEYCNQVTAWISDVILSQHDIKKRSTVIKYWVQVAEKLRGLNNFNTCMAVLSAFDNSSVGRLKRTWDVVGPRTTQVLQNIRRLMGANKNFIEYRDLIHSINPPCIPFLGIYLQDLTFIEDGNPNEIVQVKKLINFAKRAKTAEVIREIQQFQTSLYLLKPVEELQIYIRKHLDSTRDEDQLYNESLKIEPREPDDAKITRVLHESGFL